MAELDRKVIQVRQQSKGIREGISNYVNETNLRRDMETLDKMIQDALVIVGKLKGQISKKNMDKVISDVDLAVKKKFRNSYKERARLAGQAASTLSGIRSLLLSQYNDLVDLVNSKLAELPPEVAVRTTELLGMFDRYLGRDVSPIVDNFDSGGRIVGIARDSVSGDPVSDALVGFKKQKEDIDYFYETRTNHTGEYQSPYLLPGTYFVDIEKEGYINVQNQPVGVQIGQQLDENISMSAPLADSTYRVTLSWTNQKENAVKDVDSYLKIPGVEQLLSYRNKGRNYYGSHLDRDDTNWIGPETITISDLKDGTYIYYVNNYSDRGNVIALGNSNIRVRLYKGSKLIKDFSVPQGRGLSYELFRIEDGSIKITGVFNDSLVMH